MKNFLLVLLVVIITTNLFSQNSDLKNNFKFSYGNGSYLKSMITGKVNSFTVEYCRNIYKDFETGISFSNLNYYFYRDILVIENNYGLNINYKVLNSKYIYFNLGTGILYFETKSNRIYFPPSDLASYIYDSNYGYQINTILGFNFNKKLSFFLCSKYVDKLSEKIKYYYFDETPNYFVPNANRYSIEFGIKVNF